MHRQGEKAAPPYEFGCKISIATPVRSPKGAQVVLHAKALHGNPFDGHTLGPVVADIERLAAVEARRIHVEKGYRGHNHPHRFRVWISGQVRRVTESALASVLHGRFLSAGMGCFDRNLKDPGTALSQLQIER